ncbi:DUF6760 family protein [Paenibacillus arenilitoris]|uniref:DUF6760 domain-containing protein n=1 Tax=Paenibacillus arenilitoris TaxID=2772299 RepID=A0A927H468_9BACL|nr:DUF6760 family protein [Paenibacillus arenilitoris]MBD2867590.1 hypothetical protein [Paenibacillus arenilitoris]
MRPRLRGGRRFFVLNGGPLLGYPADRLYEEVGFVAYYFHWSHDDIMNMEHAERRRWCDEISKINRKLNDETEGKKNIFDVFGKR